MLPHCAANFLDPRLQLFVLVGKGQFGAFAGEGFSDAVGNRQFAGNANDQGSFATENSHGCSPYSNALRFIDE
ncbi:MAG: hypothetical protein MH208_00020 [Marinobacter sp.]|nr:hypothetical protein [Marinobacter sp.]